MKVLLIIFGRIFPVLAIIWFTIGFFISDNIILNICMIIMSICSWKMTTTALKNLKELE